ncbi:hypothetical protein [Streptomyces sp. PR69]|uniref:hypothetical protein n=1 Tax=Streptomyces sp. PR69 TaxID=2984950 RepID=UPI00226493AD|nr:hypothetical protein [Streptomyces sp. PR69]
MNRKSALAVTAGAVAVLGVAAAFAVPAAVDWYDNRHQEISTYASGAEAKNARTSVPRWLPDDATSVKYSMKTTGGERLLVATLADGALPAECKPLKGFAPAAEIETDWFPKNVADKATAKCGLYYAFTDGTTLTAWSTDQEWRDARTS